MDYESTVLKRAESAPGVSYRIVKASFNRRLELVRMIHELARRLEFLQAAQDPVSRIGAGLAAKEIDATYLRWGLHSVDSLSIDGQAASPALVAESGPESLCEEILAAIKAECTVKEEERKN